MKSTTQKRLKKFLALGLCLAVLVGWGSYLHAENQAAKGFCIAHRPPILDKEKVPAHIPLDPHIVLPCNGPDPAVVKMVVTKNPAPTATQKGHVRISARIQNLGKADFVSRRNQQSIMVMAHNAKISGSSGLKTITTRSFANLPKGASIQVTTGYDTWYSGFLGWGWRKPRYGECQAEEELIVMIAYDPDIRMDSNKQNDDCNLNNNKKVYKLRYMVRCPW